ncbi:MAG: hypothetical protein Q8K96_17565 [Rubrivivax sp.]|nr:hypothetical protein [Rubrivivax sp.]
MRKISHAIAIVSLSLVPALPPPVAAQGSGGKTADQTHAVVLICGTIGSAGTNLLTLYVQGISSDDPIALAAVGVPTQPPPGIECGAALAKLMSLDTVPPPPGPKKQPAAYTYAIQSVVSLQYAWVYTLVSK